ncbi:MAG: DUF6178 family protein [Desulfobacterales bacterium]|nr:DUF6178 family protein [Desulfobacterales bacterium]
MNIEEKLNISGTLSKADARRYKKRLEIMAMEQPEKALDAILSDPTPAALVQSFPRQDLYFLVNDIGVEDALPVLSVASSAQWGYFIDIEVWDKDRVDPDALTRWFDLLLKADPKRCVNWMVSDQTAFFEAYLARYIEVRVREKNEDPSDFGPGWFTFDDWFYIKHRELAEEKVEDGALYIHPDDRNDVVFSLLQTLSETDHPRFQSVLLEAMSVLSSEVEEENYRLRNVRLSEEGFYPFEEALGVYAPLASEDVADGLMKRAPVAGSAATPGVHANTVSEGDLFSNALAEVDEGETLASLQMEFAALCNRVISADQKQVQERAQLKGIVSKVCGYISIGLSLLDKGEKGPRSMGAWLSSCGLEEIFRVGYGKAMALKFKADRWRRESWLLGGGHPLSLLGEAWMGVMGGLLLNRPLFFDNYQTGALYREFASLDDIEATEAIFSDVEGLDNMVGFLAPDVALFKGPSLTLKSLLLTLWTPVWLGEADHSGPVDLDQVRRLLDEIFEEGKEGKRQITDAAKSHFLSWLSEAGAVPVEEVSHRLAGTLERLFAELADEYGPVTPHTLDARFVHFFILTPEEDLE